MSPLRSTYAPGTGIADAAEPWAVVQNPASLATLQGFSLGLRHTETTQTTWFGRGTGVYYAQPLPLLSRIQLGGALELLRPPSETLDLTSGKLSLALAVRVLPWLHLGLHYAHLFARSEVASYDGLDTVSLGLRLLGGRYLAFGAVLHDLPAPRPKDGTLPPLQRSYELELLSRPLGDERWELALGTQLSEVTRELAPRLRLWVRPRAGLSLGAEAQLLLSPQQNSLPEYRFGVGLQLDFARIGFALFGLAGSSADSLRPGFGGGSLALRVSGEDYPSLPAGRQTLYKIDLGQRRGHDLLRLLLTLRRIETDPRAQGVLVVLSDVGGSWGLADELRQALQRLRTAKKRVFAYGADLSTREFYIAAAAEKVFLDPVGSVRLQGVQQGGFFFKDALEHLGIRADLVRVGDWKGSPEQYTRSEPSQPVRAQRQSVLDDIWTRLRDGIAQSRRLPPARVEALFAQGILTAKAALSAQLVDAVVSSPQLEEQLATLLGEPARLSLPPPEPRSRSAAPLQVAVIHVDGDLVEGKSRAVPMLDFRTVGGESLLTALTEAARDPSVRALVLRVDSPGGSALWADLLARQVEEISRYKPVICSFGDTAASGGYYLSAPCAQIFTNPSTVTGSIGIFGGKVDLSGLLQRLGVHRVALQQGSHADMDLPYRPYSDDERAAMQVRLQQGYDRFVAVVAQGRKLSTDAVHAVAQGRIWTGAQAQQHKLTDQLGGLADAVAAARQRAGLNSDEGELLLLPRKESSLLGTLLELAPGLVSDVQAAQWPGLLSQLQVLIPRSVLALLSSRDGTLMRLEDELPR